MVVTTLLLMLGVGVGTLVIGGGLAWLVTAYRFPHARPAGVAARAAAGDAGVHPRLRLPLDLRRGRARAGVPALRARRRVVAAGRAVAPGCGGGDVAVAVPLRLPAGPGGARRAVADDVRRRAHARREPDPGVLARGAPAGPTVAGRRPRAGDDGDAHRLRHRAVLRGQDRLGRGLPGVEGVVRLPVREPARGAGAAVRGRGPGRRAAHARPGPLHPARRPRAGPAGTAPDRLARLGGHRALPARARGRVPRAGGQTPGLGRRRGVRATRPPSSTRGSASTSPTASSSPRSRRPAACCCRC